MFLNKQLYVNIQKEKERKKRNGQISRYGKSS